VIDELTGDVRVRRRNSASIEEVHMPSAREIMTPDVTCIGEKESLAAAEVLRTMGSHQVRRLPVIDGHDLVGMVALADVARALSDRPVGDLVDALSKP
jgi:CBS-domain-containing membrane protein